jgi:hypothetical protein
MSGQDLQQIFESARAKLAENDQEHISEDLVSRIRAQFLYLIGKDDGIYWMTFADALDWLEEKKEGDSLYEARNNFKKRFLKPPSIFIESHDAKDLGRHYTIMKFTKAEMDARRKIHTGKESGLKSEISFSTEGFKLFCISQSSTKSQAVWLYFLEVEKDYHRVLHAEQADIVKERNALRARNEELEKAQGDKPMNEFLTDEKTTALIKKIEDERQALEVDMFNRNIELANHKKSIYELQCVADESGNAESLRSAASVIIRDRYTKYKFDILLVNPAYVKQRKAKQIRERKEKPEKKPLKPTSKLHAGDMPDFSSDSDHDSPKISEKPSCKPTRLFEPGILDPHGNIYSESEFIIHSGAHTSEPYMDRFSNMSALDLDPECCYFFALSPKSRPEKFNDSDARFIGVLEFCSTAEVRYAISLLGNPIVSRPNKVYLTSYDTVRSCADQAICDLMKPATKPLKKPRFDYPSDSDSECVGANSDDLYLITSAEVKKKAELHEAKLIEREAARMEYDRQQYQDDQARLQNLRISRTRPASSLLAK